MLISRAKPSPLGGNAGGLGPPQWWAPRIGCPSGQRRAHQRVPVGRCPGAPPALQRWRMIQEVDEALRGLIRREALNGSDVEVVFDAPTKDWAGRRNAPTIDVYLYDIREDLRRRERGLINEYDEGQRIAARHLPPRHFKLSYLVTAWTQRPEDEHRLLSGLLSCFLRYDAIPADLLTGPLAELGAPVPITIALPPPEDRSFADVWSALGGELKPSLDVQVTAPVDSGTRMPAAPLVLEAPRIGVTGPGGAAEHAGGRRRGRRRRRPPAASAASGAVADETRTVGAEHQQGRIVRIRELP